MTKPALELLVATTIAVVAGYFLWEAQELLPTAALAPVAVCAVVGTLAVVQMAVAARAIVRSRRSVREGARVDGEISGPADAATGPGEPAGRSLPVILFSFAAFAVGIWLLGFRVGSSITTLGFLRLFGGERWTTSLLLSGGVYATFLIVFDFLLRIPFPPGLVGDALGNASIDVVLIDWLSRGFRGG